MIDYCTTRKNPEEPNDCVFFPYDNKNCCFNPEKKICVLSETSNSGLLCEEDYFYNYIIGEEKYDEYKGKEGYCVFEYGNIKGVFKYDEKMENTLTINEAKNLIINCVSDQGEINNHISFLFYFVLFLII